ncbi:hypothetical protein RJ53_08525 [Methanocalculus chunghsingensis]|uniref:Uncharacterized protein n=1 Tax=Methanocalculus chunghsingensis TaxID=156457 RepID=A0A8J7WB72_9EURY|nr:hypothetical protein [Methanocalculus chunghsingensis]
MHTVVPAPDLVALRAHHEINEHRPAYAIEGFCIGVSAPPEHLPVWYAGQLLHLFVPCDDCSPGIDDEGGIRQEGNDLLYSLF